MLHCLAEEVCFLITGQVRKMVSVCVLNIDVYGVRVCVTYQCECMVLEKSAH
jgi:hypothetical protein